MSSCKGDPDWTPLNHSGFIVRVVLTRANDNPVLLKSLLSPAICLWIWIWLYKYFKVDSQHYYDLQNRTHEILPPSMVKSLLIIWK